MALAFYLMVKSFHNLNIIKVRHRILAYIQLLLFAHVSFFSISQILFERFGRHFIKICIDTLSIPIKVHFGIWMLDRYALREINNCQLIAITIHHQIELIIVSMYEPIFCEVD